jgi:hypothetical protein
MLEEAREAVIIRSVGAIARVGGAAVEVIPPNVNSPLLDGWQIIERPIDGKLILAGFTYSDSRPGFEGKFITTSSILSLDISGRKAQTKNTTYRLGIPAGYKGPVS